MNPWTRDHGTYRRSIGEHAAEVWPLVSGGANWNVTGPVVTLQTNYEPTLALAKAYASRALRRGERACQQCRRTQRNRIRKAKSRSIHGRH